jgi:hypothetical protein
MKKLMLAILLGIFLLISIQTIPAPLLSNYAPRNNFGTGSGVTYANITFQNITDNLWTNDKPNYYNSQTLDIMLNLYTLTSSLINKVGNWSADKSNYYDIIQVNLINTSMKNYVLYVNSTNGIGGIGSSTPVITEWYNTSRTNYSTNSATAFTTIADLNTTKVLIANNNYTFDCKIRFTSNTTTTGLVINMLTTGGQKDIVYTADIPVAADGVSGNFQGFGTFSNDSVIGTGVGVVNTPYVARISGNIWVGATDLAVVPTYRAEIVRMVVNVTYGSNCRWTLLNG